MSIKLDIFNKNQIKQDIPDIRSGDIVRVHQKVKEKDKERIQVFEGLVIAKKHGKGPNGTFTVRKISSDVGVERIFPFHCPTIEKIELVKRSKVRRAKLYYMRERRGKKARMKTKELLGVEWRSEVKPKPATSQPEADKQAVTPSDKSKTIKTDSPQSESLGEQSEGLGGEETKETEPEKVDKKLSEAKSSEASGEEGKEESPSASENATKNKEKVSEPSEEKKEEKK